MHRILAIVTALLVAASALVAGGSASAQSKSEIVIGVQCDRTGPTQIVGTILCPGMHDYFALVNSKGGIEGHLIKAPQTTTRRVPRWPSNRTSGLQKDGAVSIACTVRRRSTRSPPS
jgi:branched-chain amino acid transport system substrate-binding protein